ncbi:MAG: hypothetical protein WCO69_03600 [Candidatus Omnitrophota bacterium]
MYKKSFSILTAIFLFFCSQASFAAVTLSINPVDGSNSLRFREADGFNDRKEIRIRVNSTDGKRYQVFQRLNEPMVNEKGESLDLRAMQTAAMPNSNGSGTLYTQSLDKLGMGEQLLYTSGQGGESDSFVVAYGIDPTVFNGNGNFAGRLVFTARAIGEPAQDQSFVNISVESRTDTWKAVLSGGRNRAIVRVKDTDVDPSLADFIKLSFSGNSGANVRVTQEVGNLPRNAAGAELVPGVLKFSVEGANAEGVKAADAVPLTWAGTVLYYGRGDANDLMVRFFVDPAIIAAQDAGLYNGKMKYVIETEKGREELLMDIELEIKPVFTVDVSLPLEGVSFANVLPNAPATDREVEVKVSTNLHRPYQVLQDLTAPMSNDKGEEMKKDYFTVKVEVPAEVKGRTKFTDFVPMLTGERPVFSSDAQGSPAVFKVIYRLQGYPQMSGGNFKAPIRFSLNQN